MNLSVQKYYIRTQQNCPIIQMIGLLYKVHNLITLLNDEMR